MKELAALDDIVLSDDVATYIAGPTSADLVELDGSLIRLIAYASLTRQELSLALAQEVLDKILGSGH